jgi:aspartate/methionine/tyrosine aminotransferase
VTYPFWLKKLLVESGLGNWIPGAQTQIPDACHILPLCTDKFLQGPLDRLSEFDDPCRQVGHEFLDLSREHVMGLGSAVKSPIAVQTTRDPLTTGETVIREKVSEFLGTYIEHQWDPETEILITAGPQQALQIILDTFINPGEKVLLTDPCPRHHHHLAAFHGAQIQWLSLRQEEGRLKFSEREMKYLMQKSKLAIFSLPSNPMGGCFHEDDLATISVLASKNRCLLFWDTSLMTLSMGEKIHHPDALRQMREQSLFGGCMGPAFGPMASQAGWLCASSRILSPCKTLVQMQMRIPGLQEQFALAEAIKSCNTTEHSNLLQRLRQNRSHAYQRLSAMGFEPYWPQAGCHFWIPVWQKLVCSSDMTNQFATRSQVLVSRGDLNGPSGNAYIRVSYGVDESRLDEALRRMAIQMNGESQLPAASKLAA